MTERRLVVHKFGGTSVGGGVRIGETATLIAERQLDENCLVVVSAMATITNRLLAVATAAAGGHLEVAETALVTLREDHYAALTALELLDADDITSTRASLEDLFTKLGTVVRAVAGVRELTPRVRDYIAVFGEKMSARLVAAALRKRGCAAEAINADSFLETDGVFGNASPIDEATERSVRRALLPLVGRGVVPVVTGFCGRAPDGSTTTLGRGGSDFSATILGGSLDAACVVIWTDVDGVFTADPRSVPQARLVEQLHYREAAELAFYGAKVLHPRTLQPVSSRNIPVEVRNSFRPDAPFTVVDGRLTPGSHPVKAISAVPGQALVALEGRGMAGVPGVAARLFGALAAANISVTVISQSSAESSICVAVPASEAADAEVALKREFRLDLTHGDIEEIVVRPRVGLVAAVGIGMAHSPGVAGRVFGALGRAGVNVLAIAQGSTELNITLACDEGAIGTALTAIHDEFGLHRRDTGAMLDDGFDVFIHGFGKIGRRVATMLHERSDRIHARFGLHPRVVAVSDGSGVLVVPRGFDIAKLNAAVDAKRDGATIASLEGSSTFESLEALARDVFSWRFSVPIVVDTTADAASEQFFEAAMFAGADVVTANKWPLAAPAERWQRLQAVAESTGRMIRGEATVGAGLPIIDTFEMLLTTGDTVHTVEGCLSGTLGFVLGEISAGRRFSDAVLEAWDLGYTEPDPVLDLLGTDVLRKAIILRRVAGLDDGDVAAKADGLVDASLLGASRATLTDALRALDAHYADVVRTAVAAGGVLRYVARVSASSVSAGLETVALDSPLGRLSRGDNMVVIHSERYASRPLTITGPGAGTDVTAMGVMSDILRIVAERGGRAR